MHLNPGETPIIVLHLNPGQTPIIVLHLNPGQTPIIAFDQPHFALAKKIQLHHPDTYGQLVTMMGPLHTEMAFLNTDGDLLMDSDWAIR